LAPALELKREPTSEGVSHIVANVYLSGNLPDDYEVDLRVTRSRGYWGGGNWAPKKEFSRTQELIHPIDDNGKTLLQDQDTGQVIGYQYRFRGESNKLTDAIVLGNLYRAKVRLKLENGLTLPAIERQYESGELVVERDDGFNVDADQPGWSYANELTVYE
jgi:hypothetical protein